MSIRQSAPEDRTIGPAGSAAEPTSSEDLPPGATIDRYLVLSRLGAGGMGVVYAAYDPELGRNIAIKLLRGAAGSAAAGDTQGRMRLLREAQAMARLSHPNVILVFDVGTAFDQIFVAMEFIDGGTLGDWLKEPHSQEEILTMFTLAGRGLAAAHAAGLVHRDFKPDNVLIGKDGRVRVTDFGLVRDIGAPQENGEASAGKGPRQPSSSVEVRLASLGLPPGINLLSSQPLSQPMTQAGALMGTPRYMAPEQFMNQATDQRTDLFSFCVALYESLFGVSPFAGTSIGDRCYNVISGIMQPPPADKRVPKWLRSALLRGLSVEPNKRPPTMAALLADLSLENRRARRRWLGGIAALITLVFLAGLSLALLRAHKRLQAYQCANAAQSLKSVWGAERKQAVLAALLKSGHADTQDTQDTWQRVQQNIDGHLEKWQAVRDRQCRAAFERQELPPALLERSLSCLDRRLHSIGVLGDMLLKADAAMFTQATELSSNLEELDECEDRILLGSLAPEKKELRAQIDDLYRQMMRIRLTGEFGRYVEQRELAKKTLDTALKLGQAPVIADAKALLAGSESDNSEYDSAGKNYFESLLLSTQGGDRRSAVLRLLDLMSLAGTKLGHPEEAFRWGQLADAELANVVSSERIKLKIKRRMLFIACRIHHSTEPVKLALAEKECKQALEVQRQLYPPGHPREFGILANLAVVYKRQDRLTEARALYEQVLTFDERSRGSQHESVAATISNIGRIFEAEDKYEEAKKSYERALQMEEHTFGPSHPRLLNTLNSLVGLNVRRKDFAAATQQAQRALKIQRQATGSDDHAKMAGASSQLAWVLSRQGRLAEAVPLYQKAVDICQKRRCSYAASLVGLGESLLGLGKGKQALPLLEDALKLNSAPDTSPTALARSQFVLAKVLWTVDRKRSRERIQELTASALLIYEKSGRTSRHELAEVKDWASKSGLPSL